MAKGDGTIIEKARGVWEVQVSLGRDPITGRYRRKSRTVRGTKADARKVRDQIRSELESGIKADADKVTFREFSKQWIEARRAAGEVKPRTLKQDEARVEFLSEIIGDVPLSKIDARTIESLYREIRRRRIAQGYRCGSTNLHSYHVLVKSIMKKAVNYDLIARNPCDRVDAPKLDKVERKSLTAEDASRLLRAVDRSEERALADLAAKEKRQEEWGVSGDRGYLLGIRDISGTMAVRVGLAAGMRLSEVLNLVWAYTDLAGNCVQIVDSKSDAGKRIVSLDEKTVGHLARWKEMQGRLMASIGMAQSDGTPVICSCTFGKFEVHNFETWWRKFRKDNGFDGLKFHELRHTQATLLLAQGVDVKTVQARLGHSNASLTLNWYAHAVPENDEKAARLIGSLLGDGAGSGGEQSPPLASFADDSQISVPSGQNKSRSSADKINR